MNIPIAWVVLVAPALLAGPIHLGIASAGILEQTPLVAAARSSDIAAVRALLSSGADVNEAEPDGATALHWASHRDDLDTVDLLIRAGAEVDAANDLGATPLWNACENGSDVMVGRLLAAGANPNSTLLSGETPLMMAARAGASEVVVQLLAHGADTERRGARGQTALMWAVAQRHVDVVEALLAHGVDVQARSDVWSQVMAAPPHGFPEHNRDIPHGGNTALLFAARVGALASSRLLVAAGADVDDQNAWGVSATVLAAHSGDIDLVEFLLEEGADPSAADAGFSALHAAVMRRDGPLTEALLKHGADPNAVLTTWTPTRRASRDFHFAPSLVGATPFWLAARFAEPKLMQLLAASGADPEVVLDVRHLGRYETHHDVASALMASVGMGAAGVRTWIAPRRAEPEDAILEAVTLAVELGADPNVADPQGNTALHGAARAGFDRVIAHLVEHGADLHAKNRDGLTPLAAAMALDQESVTVDLLRSLEAAIVPAAR